MKIVDFFEKIGYMEIVLEDLNKCENEEERRIVFLEWISREFELEEGEDLDRVVDIYLERMIDFIKN